MANPPSAADHARFTWRARKFIKKLRHGDEVAHLITLLAAASIIVVTVMLVYQLYINCNLPRHKFGFEFFTGRTWDPVSGDFGALPFIYGTLVSSALALLLAVPLGVGAAIFLSELAPPRISNYLTFVIELLAAIPSVIYGVVGIFILVPVLRTVVMPFLKHTLGFLPLFKGPIYGVSMLAGGVVLAIMIVPYIISVSREVLLAVPVEQREAALGLGATKWESTWQVVVPFARVGIMASVFLALARALGETMAVTMVIGNSPEISRSLLANGSSMASVIANEFAEASSELHLSALMELGLALFIVTIIVNAFARLLVWAVTRGEPASTR